MLCASYAMPGIVLGYPACRPTRSLLAIAAIPVHLRCAVEIGVRFGGSVTRLLLRGRTAHKCTSQRNGHTPSCSFPVLTAAYASDRQQPVRTTRCPILTERIADQDTGKDASKWMRPTFSWTQEVGPGHLLGSIGLHTRCALPSTNVAYVSARRSQECGQQ
eukprot:455059-Rhodomonas_salina.1